VKCDEARSLLDAYLDHELADRDQRRVEAHLGGCTACAAAEARLAELIATIRGATCFEPPDHLAHEVHLRLRDEAGVERPAGPPAAEGSIRWWLSIGATAIASAAISAWLVLTLLAGPSAEQLALREVAAAHVRSLIQDHLLEVASADPHTVKPWFAGRIDFVPQPATLAPDGFELRGARLDYLQERPVAAIVFKRREHIINLFVWPAPGPERAGIETFTKSGFNLIRWQSAGLVYWAVSDLGRNELRSFAEALEATTDDPITIE
jgi:anti-sigma factor RsiW